MTTFRLLSLFVFLYLLSYTTYANEHVNIKTSHKKDKQEVACTINTFTILDVGCNEDGVYCYEFTVSGTDFGLNGFTLTASNINYSFNYTNTNYVFCLPATCMEDVFVTITDNDNPNCNATLNVGRVCCSCNLYSEITQSDCIDSRFNTVIQLTPYGSCENVEPTIKVNGVEQQYDIINWRYHLNNLIVYTPFVEYEICYDVPGFELQCETTTIANPCFPLISNFQILQNSNQCVGDSLQFQFSFDGPFFGLYGFTVSSVAGGNRYYKIGDEYIYKVAAECYGDITISIFDNNHPENTVDVAIGPACCPCSLNYVYSISDCENSGFDISINVNEVSGSCIQNFLTLTINSDTFQLVGMDTLYHINDYQCNDSLLYLVLCSNLTDTSFCYRDTIANPCFFQNTGNQCTISNFVVTPDSTSCVGEGISLVFSYTGQDFGTNGYTITTNTGFSQTFSLTDSTFWIMLADCAENIIITITDNNNSTCSAMDTIGLLCCPCLTDIDFSHTNCIDGAIQSNISFSNQQGSCINYDWTLYINGQNQSLNLSNTGYNINVSNTTDSLLIYEFCSGVPGLIECFIDTLVNPCYEPTTSNQCTIANFSVAADTSSCMGEIISLGFSYDGSHFGTNGYNISTNTGFNQFFDVNDPQSIVVIADCTENVIITITDANDATCTAVDTVGFICCPCEVDFIATTSACVDGITSANFTITNLQGSCMNGDWTATVNGQAHLIIPTNTGFSITGINSTDSLLTFTLCYELAGIQECLSTIILNPCFESTVDVSDPDIDKLMDVLIIPGQQILMTNKSDKSINYYLFAVDGTILNYLQPLQPQGSKTIDISLWPSGVYIFKANTETNTYTKKLINVR